MLRHEFDSDLVGKPERFYSLDDVANHLKVKESTKDTKKRNSALGEKCMEAICEKSMGRSANFKVESDKEIEGMRRIPGLLIKSTFRPDIIVYYKGEYLVLLADVQSSSMFKTERRVILHATYMIRFLRSSDVKVKKVAAFALPNTQMDSGACIVKVEVEWKSLRFHYRLQRYQGVSAGVEAIIEVLRHQCGKLPKIPSEPYNSLIRLSTECCELICSDHNGTQLKSPLHIMVRHQGYIYKVLYDYKEQISHYLVRDRIGTAYLENVIVPEKVEIPSIFDLYVFRYQIVDHSPMTVEEARKCLYYLVIGIHKALSQLHSLGLCHNDVRLPNFCFNSSYEVVLIDLDRCALGTVPPTSFGESCMYDMGRVKFDQNPSRQSDFFQLGVLVAWILDTPADGDYHGRKIENIKSRFCDDCFMEKLLNELEFDKEALENSTLNKEEHRQSIQVVLERRN